MFSDLLREVRRQLWGAKFFKWSQENPDHEKIVLSEEALSLMDQLAEAA